MRTETDLVFRLAGVHDPFTAGNPSFMVLEIPDRKRMARQVGLLCTTIEGQRRLCVVEVSCS